MKFRSDLQEYTLPNALFLKADVRPCQRKSGICVFKATKKAHHDKRI